MVDLLVSAVADTLVADLLVSAVTDTLVGDLLVRAVPDTVVSDLLVRAVADTHAPMHTLIKVSHASVTPYSQRPSVTAL